LALLCGEAGIASLSHGGAKNVETADVLVLGRDAAERFVQSFGTAPGQLGDATYPEDFEIAKHGRANGDQV
jgi:hypothetical protein